jgi:GT2 family glycosyltransferase
MVQGPVMLGYVSGGTCRVEFLGAVLNAVSGPNSDPAIGGVISSSAGPLVALARNLLAEQFLTYDLEWLCMVDTDIVFAPDAVSRLLEDADPIHQPIMSALYYVFEDGMKIPAAYVNDGVGSELDIHPIEDFEDPEIVRVFSVGAGFLLVHRSVFETIKKDSAGERCWFREGVIAGRDFGEDVSFCIRAAISGFPVHVNTGVRVGHIKSAMLGEVK